MDLSSAPHVPLVAAVVVSLPIPVNVKAILEAPKFL